MQRRPTPPPPPPRSRGYFFFVIIFTIGAVGIWFLLNRDNLREFSQTYRNREKARIEIAKTKERMALLKRQQQSLALNGVESEKQIRERLQMHMPGEKVVFFRQEGETTPAIVLADTPATAVLEIKKSQTLSKSANAEEKKTNPVK